MFLWVFGRGFHIRYLLISEMLTDRKLCTTPIQCYDSCSIQNPIEQVRPKEDSMSLTKDMIPVHMVLLIEKKCKSSLCAEYQLCGSQLCQSAEG
jgi:hypothetical protein